jgi:hypothetical protein
MGKAGAACPGPISACPSAASSPPRSPPRCQPAQPSPRGSLAAAAAGRSAAGGDTRGGKTVDYSASRSHGFIAPTLRASASRSTSVSTTACFLVSTRYSLSLLPLRSTCGETPSRDRPLRRQMPIQCRLPMRAGGIHAARSGQQRLASQGWPERVSGHRSRSR